MDLYRQVAQFFRDRDCLYRAAHPPYMMALKTVKEARVHWKYRGRLEPSSIRGNDLIRNTILEGHPTAVGKLNSLEAEALIAFLKNPPGPKRYSPILAQQLEINVGLFPPTAATFDRFSELFIEALGMMDILAVWGNYGEAEIIKLYCNKSRLVRLHSLEAFRFHTPWSAALEGKRVLVIHPFIDTIERQMRLNRARIWPNRLVLPDFELVGLKMPLSSGLQSNTDFGTWFDLLDAMKDKVSALNFDVALIGAGGMSLLLATHIKHLGKVAIHTGGPTQIFFGIRGRRWDSSPSLRPVFNEHWTRPSAHETPARYKKVEGGGYW